jgi:hypothetical protein
MKRCFGFWSLLGSVTSGLTIWEAVLSLLSLGLTNGGPAGLIHCYIVSWLSSMWVYLVVSELVLYPLPQGASRPHYRLRIGRYCCAGRPLGHA